MDCTLLTWLPDSPFRSPSWRYLRANYLQQRGKHTDHRIDDTWITRTMRFLAAEDRHKDGIRQRRLDPALLAATEIYEKEPPERRSLLEALLLTTEPFDAIACRLGLPVDVVELYHHVFFDTRDYLAATDWIMRQVIGTSWLRGFAGLPIGAVWKYVGFAAGPLVLDVVVAVCTGQPLPATVRNSFADPAFEEPELRLRCKLTIGALRANSDAQFAELIAVRNKFQSVGSETSERFRKPSGMQQVMELFLGGLSGRRSPRKGSKEIKRATMPDVTAFISSEKKLMEIPGN